MFTENEGDAVEILAIADAKKLSRLMPMWPPGNSDPWKQKEFKSFNPKKRLPLTQERRFFKLILFSLEIGIHNQLASGRINEIQWDDSISSMSSTSEISIDLWINRVGHSVDVRNAENSWFIATAIIHI
ncbi:hypothetical protein D3C71_1563840 [compost metagenome]